MRLDPPRGQLTHGGLDSVPLPVSVRTPAAMIVTSRRRPRGSDDARSSRFSGEHALSNTAIVSWSYRYADMPTRGPGAGVWGHIYTESEGVAAWAWASHLFRIGDWLLYSL